MDSALESQLDRNYRYQRHVYDLTREYYLLGRNKLLSGLKPARGESVLEIGCGTARNLIRAARTYPQAHFYGIDLSRLMLETADKNLKRSRFSDRIHLAHADATDFEARELFNRPLFDRVFFSYSLSMIPDWQLALDLAIRHLAPGGSLHIVDFGTGDALPSIANAGLRSWLRQFHVVPRDGLGSALEQCAAAHDAHLVVKPLFRTYAVHAVLSVK